jgi:hypothetical protein
MIDAANENKREIVRETESHRLPSMARRRGGTETS